ncbi:MAG TPA: hypothetical protein VM677_15760 [Actinokineospora sp.]|nr:hypothetical protein [Actinokineospora sp.]
MTLSFIDAYTIWRGQPFPGSGKNEVLIGVRHDLAEADEYVTTVIRFVDHGIHRPMQQTDVLAFLDEILERVARFAEAASGKDLEIARSQHAYAAILRLVYAQFLELAPSEHV